MTSNMRLKILIFLFFTSGLVGCDGDAPRPPAPIGERAALEALAEAYEAISQQVDSNPRTLPPRERLRFVRFVFEKAGYDYEATLEALAQVRQPDPMNVYPRDLAELLLMPHRAGGGIDPAELYDEPELGWVLQIEETFF